MNAARRQGPDFSDLARVLLCIGAQKAGTTWLHEAMRAHPEVHVSRIKEVHYWDAALPPHGRHHARRADAAVAELERQGPLRRLARRLHPARAAAAEDARRYRRMFREMDPAHRSYQEYLMAEWAGEPVVADISPGYALMGSEGFAAMDALAPDARFVFILRDPVSRLWSNVRHARSRGLLDGGRDADLDAAFHRFVTHPHLEAHRRSDYATTIRALEAAVPRERIAYLFHETMFEPAEMARLSSFLGIAPIAADTGRRVNPGSDEGAAPDPNLLALARETFAPTYEFAAGRFGRALPEAWRRHDQALPQRVPA